jgi:hypothetical protein
MKQWGVTAAQLKQIQGCDAATLKKYRYTAQDLKEAGEQSWTWQYLKGSAPFTWHELKQAGCTYAEAQAAGFTFNEQQWDANQNMTS